MAEEEKMDETIPGGLYIKDGQVVDCDGKVVPGYSVVNGKAVKDRPTKASKAEETKAP